MPAGPAAADDRRAFEALIAEHLPGLQARARQLCRARTDPDDLVQDTLMRAFRSREQLRDRSSVRSWLMSITMNTFLDTLRRQRARPQPVSLDIEPAAASTDDEPTEPLPWQRISAAALRSAIDQLPDDIRDTYRRFALDGQDYVAIAAAQGIPKATVGTRLMRARRKLRALLAVVIEEAP